MANNTGTNNSTYNLVSVLYHALQGADLYEQYASDASGDQDLAGFFRGHPAAGKAAGRARQAAPGDASPAGGLSPAGPEPPGPGASSGSSPAPERLRSQGAIYGSNRASTDPTP